jgi:hypothetical protein
MAKSGLKKWFSEKWVDISAKASRMTESEKRSAVARKRAAGNVGPKPTNVKTFTKRYYGGMIDV